MKKNLILGTNAVDWGMHILFCLNNVNFLQTFEMIKVDMTHISAQVDAIYMLGQLQIKKKLRSFMKIRGV